MPLENSYGMDEHEKDSESLALLHPQLLMVNKLNFSCTIYYIFLFLCILNTILKTLCFETFFFMSN